MVNWRAWAYQRLTQDPLVTDLISPESIYGAGSSEGRPESLPAMILRFNDRIPRLGGTAEDEELQVWVHGNPGAYDPLDDILAAVRVSFESVESVVGGYPPVWQHDSPDRSDDQWDTITKYSSYGLLERRTS